MFSSGTHHRSCCIIGPFREKTMHRYLCTQSSVRVIVWLATPSACMCITCISSTHPSCIVGHRHQARRERRPRAGSVPAQGCCHCATFVAVWLWLRIRGATCTADGAHPWARALICAAGKTRSAARNLRMVRIYTPSTCTGAQSSQSSLALKFSTSSP